MKILNNKEMQSVSGGIGDIMLNTIAGLNQLNFAIVIGCNTILSLGLFAATEMGRKAGPMGVVSGVLINSAFYGLGYSLSSVKAYFTENINKPESLGENMPH